MNKKRKSILLIALLLVVAVIASKPLWQGESATGKTAASGELYADNSPDNESAPGNGGTDTQKPDEKAGPATGLANMVNAALGKNEPAVLVFTYNADCCPSTKEFFDKHRAAVKKLEQNYASGANFVWIDVALYDRVDRDALMEVANKYGVTAIPAVVLIDAKGKPLPVMMGELDEKAASDKLAGLVKKK